MRSRLLPWLRLLVLFASPVSAADRAAACGGARAPAIVQPTPDDVAALRSASDVAISPDGTRIVYSLGTPTLDPKAKPSEKDTEGGWKRDRQVWVVDVEGGDPRQLTRGVEQANAPV